MTRSRSSLGLFGMFGRSADLRQFDAAFRSVDLHPRLVPEAVKLAAVNFLKDHAGGSEPTPQAYQAAAELLGYLMIGADAFAGANDERATLAVERRIEAALAWGTSLDAQLVLLALHAKVVQPSVIRQFGLESEPG